ncbi:bifunctional peptidase and arginyl-hydroxylase JMJD5 isoform X1 [Parasteatoda tepidariorum]|uniref:bifunctional peptidase and arginyl-hydroxylase JMJD5 isoform X1 n=1 Tax=Parasteatoda tepidariorum TaxID=114398 RepID=UPI001C7263F4|nr:bifunctional peptidase and arginyl-hydroxylase JMJD5 isoform X1 [Parasteatoda tepidariorum]
MMDYIQNKFRIELFDLELREILSSCKYINLPFNLPLVGLELNHLLTQCGKTFFVESCNEDSLHSTILNAKIILDFAWEKINTGHWKDVDKIWRELYSLAVVFKVLSHLVLKNTDKLDIIKQCDNGLLLGAPIMGNLLSRLAFKLSELLLLEGNDRKNCYEVKPKKQKVLNEADVVLSHKVLERSNFTKKEFIDDFMNNSKPVIITDGISNWPAMTSRSWSIDYMLEKTSFRTVPIELGSKYTDENWTQKLMTVKEFVEHYIWNQSKEIGYLAQHNFFTQIPELKEDIDTPYYIDDKAFVDISIWFGPSGTISPLHYDPKHNLLAQVLGTKYIRLYSKEQSPYVYAREDPLFYNTSQVDVENPDLEEFPLFSKAKYSECVLKPGNLLYIPPGCWHYVRSLSTSISISFWW